MRPLPTWLALAMCLLGSPAARGDEAAEEDEFKGLPHEERKAGDDAKKRYFLIGPRDEAKPPGNGHPLLVVLPGGDGGDGFLAFVKRIQKEALDPEWLVAEPVSVKWRDDQEIVWPTEKAKVPDQAFTTEEMIEAVVADVVKARKVDRARVYALGWSSSGPALYAHSLLKKKSVVGYYVAMSVFHPDSLPSLKEAKGEAYFLLHSVDDRTCPFRDAKAAEEELGKAGAKVKLLTYAGGHGWHGNVYGNITEGVKWLEDNRAKPSAR